MGWVLVFVLFLGGIIIQRLVQLRLEDARKHASLMREQERFYILQLQGQDETVTRLENQLEDTQASLEMALKTCDKELAEAHLSLGMALQEILNLENPPAENATELKEENV